MQLEFFEVPSPCIGICQSDDKGHCLGCMRSRDERQGWKHLNNDEKQKVIKRCIQREKRKQNQLKVKEVESDIKKVNEVDMQPSLFDGPTKVKTLPNTNTNTDTDTDMDLDFSDFEL